MERFGARRSLLAMMMMMMNMMMTVTGKYSRIDLSYPLLYIYNV